MGTQDNNVEVAEVTENTPTDAFAAEVSAQGQYTAEDLARVRSQEKAKLYPQLEKYQEEIALLKQEREERQAKEAERNARRAEREAKKAEEAKAAAEQEMSFKELLSAKEQEFQKQLERERKERENAFALLEREREFQELQQFRAQRIEQERENIIPELIDMVSGNSRDEIEQSILGLKDRSAKIIDSVASAGKQARQEMVGARVTAPASGPLDNDSAPNSYASGDINNMSMADYIKNRDKLLRSSSNNRGQGLFG